MWLAVSRFCKCSGCHWVHYKYMLLLFTVCKFVHLLSFKIPLDLAWYQTKRWIIYTIIRTDMIIYEFEEWYQDVMKSQIMSYCFVFLLQINWGQHSNSWTFMCVLMKTAQTQKWSNSFRAYPLRTTQTTTALSAAFWHTASMEPCMA